MSALRTGPATGLVGQVGVTAALAGTVGLGAAGWLAGLTYGLVVCALLTRGLQRTGSADLGPADKVTLARATLGGGVTALVVDSFTRSVSVSALVTLAAVAVLLDAVDGKVARRTGTVSELGARFDMEADAFLILVLSVWAVGPLGGWATGGWVLAIGAMRYAFVAGSWALPWLDGSLPPRFWRKVVAAAQGILLVVVAAGALPGPVTVVIVLVALGLLLESFGRDVAYLWRHRTTAQHVAQVVDFVPVPRSGRRATLVGAGVLGSVADWEETGT